MRRHARRPLAAGVLVLVTLALLGTSLAGRGDPKARERSAALARAIDAALERSWRERGAQPAAPAPPLTLYRRLALDLHGTIPSLEEVRALERVPFDREARVDALLADPRFHEALAERLARIVAGAGRKPDDLFYRRRRFVAWLEGELDRHRPWDAIVRDLVAAEGVTTDGPANFLVAQDADPVKLAGRTARAFLGVRLDCAQCHDHPFASWKQKDFEGLAAFFARVRRKGPLVREAPEGEYELEDRRTGARRAVEPRVPFAPEAFSPSERRRREALARWLTDRSNPWFARAIANRLWAWLLGRGVVEPADELDSGTASVPAVLDLMARDLEENGFDLERLVRAIVLTRAYGLSSEGEAPPETFAVFPLKPLHADQLAAAVYQATSLATEDGDRILPKRIQRSAEVRRFADAHGQDPDAEAPEGETLVQRFALVNGGQVHERIRSPGPFGFVRRVVALASSDERIVEALWLAALTRRPTERELERFRPRFEGKSRDEKVALAEDLLWVLVNTVEFSWNH